VFELLLSPEGVEWRDKVGVVGKSDGSAKHSLRLLCVGSWVAKTNVELRHDSLEKALGYAASTFDRGIRAALWHPDKQWFAMRHHEHWLVLSICPKMQTLRSVPALGDRLMHWIGAMRMAVRVARSAGLGLDLNPANFGFCAADPEALYYLDEECYAANLERDLANAIVARIPEELEVSTLQWSKWGEAIVHMLATEFLTTAQWQRIGDEIARYPLTPQFEGAREAIESQVVAAASVHARGQKQRSQLLARADSICVLADIHANYAALRSTLAAAKARGAGAYLILGDIVGYGPDPSPCIETIVSLPNATCISGNHDYCVATGQFDRTMNTMANLVAKWTACVLSQDEKNWLGLLPKEHRERDWLAIHGAPLDPQRMFGYVYDLTFERNLEVLRSKAIDLCFCGHTHVSQIHIGAPEGPRKLRGAGSIEIPTGAPVIVNPGSVGQPRDGDPRAAFAIWHRGLGRIEFHRTEYDYDETLRNLQANKLPTRLMDRIRSGT
jgi:diadenosine tetraphosphatase ApaH/serine/threonine PP2A family protein phosphatase